MKHAALGCLLACIASPIYAMDDMEALQLASSLGSIISSEEFCGLSYDQTAIAAYIGENVPPERMDFASNLQVNIMGNEYLLAQMSASAKTAHCASIQQTAKHFGFTK